MMDSTIKMVYYFLLCPGSAKIEDRVNYMANRFIDDDAVIPAYRFMYRHYTKNLDLLNAFKRQNESYD
jgi:hypothetical protein